MVSPESLCIYILLLLDQGNSPEIQIRPAHGHWLEDTYPCSAGEYSHHGFGKNSIMTIKGVEK